MGRRKGTSMFEPFKEDIIGLLEQGKNVKQIYRILFSQPDSGYQYQGLLNFINTNRLRFVTDNDGYEVQPKCHECKCYMRIKREEGIKDMKVCTNEKREIKYSIVVSPRWCPLRDKKRQGEL